jgi:hypothetical protein
MITINEYLGKAGTQEFILSHSCFPAFLRDKDFVRCNRGELTRNDRADGYRL